MSSIFILRKLVDDLVRSSVEPAASNRAETRDRRGTMGSLDERWPASTPSPPETACAKARLLFVEVRIPGGREIEPLRRLEAERADVGDESEIGPRASSSLAMPKLVGRLQRVGEVGARIGVGPSTCAPEFCACKT